MIRDLSLTLRAMLDAPALETAFPDLFKAQIVFDRPTETFKPTQTTVDLFLYDIRENPDLRSNQPIVERQNGQAISRRQPIRITCSYLVTAWPVGGTELALQEHRLLSQVLQVFSRYPTIPPEFLQGSLVGQEPPWPMMTAQADGLKNPAEFWSALGARMRASLNVTVTFAMTVFPAEKPVPLAITGHVRLGERVSPELEQIVPTTLMEFFRIGGRVTTTTGAPAHSAVVTLVERGLVATTDPDGRYSLGPIQSGTYTLRVQSDGVTREVSITVPAEAGRNYNMQLS